MGISHQALGGYITQLKRVAKTAELKSLSFSERQLPTWVSLKPPERQARQKQQSSPTTPDTTPAELKPEEKPAPIELPQEKTPVLAGQAGQVAGQVGQVAGQLNTPAPEQDKTHQLINRALEPGASAGAEAVKHAGRYKNTSRYKHTGRCTHTGSTHTSWNARPYREGPGKTTSTDRIDRTDRFRYTA